MRRKRMTQMFPFLLPLRQLQRKICFYIKMKFDGNKYSRSREEEFCNLVFQAKTLLINKDTGFDIKYQENKVFNLKLATKTMDKIVIKPNETFSFWQLVRFAEKEQRYKDGLCVINGHIVTVPGGGLCQLSNMLFWLFLHSPLTIIERHSHEVNDFKTPPDGIPNGTDATVSEGWLDLKVKNNTNKSFQICFFFDDEYLIGRIFSEVKLPIHYEVAVKNIHYFKKDRKILEQVEVYRQEVDEVNKNLLCEKLLYINTTEIAYQLSEDIKVEEVIDNKGAWL